MAVEGRGDSVAAVGADGSVKRVRLPLNEGQTASDLAAARDARHLFYLVWNTDGSQHGIASWNLDEPNARFIVLPLPGHRIIALFPSGDSAWLAYVQVESGLPLDEAAWRVDLIPVGGGESQLVATRETLADILPPVPFAWPVGGPLLLAPVVPGGGAAGIYAVNPQTGGGRQLFPVEGEVLISPALSPGGGELAYLVADAAGEAATTVMVRSLRLDETAQIPAPEGQTVYGVRWHADGERLLLDVVSAGQGEQRWALARATGGAPWLLSAPGPGRERLFDYQPYGEGVVYTLLPEGGEWALYLLPDLAAEAQPHEVELAAIAQEFGAPIIIRLP